MKNLKKDKIDLQIAKTQSSNRIALSKIKNSAKAKIWKQLTILNTAPLKAKCLRL